LYVMCIPSDLIDFLRDPDKMIIRPAFLALPSQNGSRQPGTLYIERFLRRICAFLTVYFYDSSVRLHREKFTMKLPSFFDPDPEDLNYKPDWKQMSTADKASYIWTYYKVPIVILVVILGLIIHAISGYINRKNDILFVGTANMAIPEEVLPLFTDDYIASDPSFGKRDSVSMAYLGTLSDASPAMYMTGPAATQMKIMASVEAGQLDVVLMDREAFDMLSMNGFLLDLGRLTAGGTAGGSGTDTAIEANTEGETAAGGGTDTAIEADTEGRTAAADGTDTTGGTGALDETAMADEADGEASPLPELSAQNLTILEQIRDLLTENTVITESNAAEAQLDPDIELHEVKEQKLLGIDLTGSGPFAGIAPEEKVYAGIIVNTTRVDQSLSYIGYLLQAAI